jgi:tetratricopeptide (TPR) repeat protein
LMRLPDRAIVASQHTIDVLRPVGTNANLSLARYILGTALTSKGNWAGAIVVWREGLVEDEQREDWLSIAQKLQCIAQALVMQHYVPGGPPVPEEAYAESMATYAQAIALLQASHNPQSLAVIANTYQLQGQSAIACNRPADAGEYLEQARNLYGKLHLAMQFGTTTIMLGLLYYDLGKRGAVDAYQQAMRYYEEALDYFRQAHMLDWTWKLAFFIAQILFTSGNLAFTGEEQHQQWQKALTFLENAAADIEFVRGTFIETSTLATQEAQFGLVSDKERVYTSAIQLHRMMHNPSGAFTWLERLKGRIFLDALALTDLHPPTQTSAILDVLLAKERKALSTLHQAKTQTEVVAIMEQLHRIWDEMSVYPTTREYVALRRGEPRTKRDIDVLLKL